MNKQEVLIIFYFLLKMASAWVDHVKAYAKSHGVSYKEAMSKASASYKKKDKTTTKGDKRKGKKPGSRLAFDDTMDDHKKEKPIKRKGGTKKGEVRKGAKYVGSRLAYD
jgi:hypothetical protein